MLHKLTDETSMRVLSASEMRAFDAHTIDAIGVPSAVLMERAALSVVEALQLPELNFDLAHVLVVCGIGNNGGDGLAVARLLYFQGVTVSVVVIGDHAKMSEECARQFRICDAYAVPVAPLVELRQLLLASTTVVDAMLGIGGDRQLRGDLADAVAAINESKTQVLAVDVPTGIADDGSVLGCAVQAHATVTFAFLKRGLLGDSTRDFTGEIYVADIGIYAPDAS